MNPILPPSVLIIGPSLWVAPISTSLFISASISFVSNPKCSSPKCASSFEGPSSSPSLTPEILTVTPFSDLVTMNLSPK